jgi:hypothetical protein
MDFFMPCWKKLNSILLNVVMGGLLCVLAVLPQTATAEGIQIKSAELRQVNEQYVLNAQFSVVLTPMLKDALNRGISLYFITDFDFSEPRWYWFQDTLVHLSRVTRLSYNTLLRQYLVSGVNTRARSVDTLDEALTILGTIDAWPVIARDKLNSSTSYRATLSMQLDTSELPKPIQINAIATGRWGIDSTPLVWTMTP